MYDTPGPVDVGFIWRKIHQDWELKPHAREQIGTNPDVLFTIVTVRDVLWVDYVEILYHAPTTGMAT